jgi:hypothetical protein
MAQIHPVDFIPRRAPTGANAFVDDLHSIIVPEDMAVRDYLGRVRLASDVDELGRDELKPMFPTPVDDYTVEEPLE